jgi:hypothetical protein
MRWPRPVGRGAAPSLPFGANVLGREKATDLHAATPVFTPVGLALFGLLFVWGAGAAMLVLPRRWRHHWPVFAPMCGIATMSAVVWIGVGTPAAGTAAYAVWTWPVPGALLAAAVILAVRRTGGWTPAVRVLGRDLLRQGPLAAVTLGVLLVCTTLMDRASPRLTSFSSGSCDAADYAAGARVMRDFSGRDRTGQLGNREVVALRSVDNFVDHWLRQNHFMPPALVAWFSGALGMKIHELVTLMGGVLLAAAVPMAYWAGRALFGFGRWTALLPAAAFGVSGPQLYAVAQVALSQVIAAGALVILTWGAIRAWQEGCHWRGALRWVPLLTVAAWLFFGAYNFMLPFALAASGLWVAIAWGRTRDGPRFGRVLTAGAIAVAVAAAFAPARLLGLADRFALFDEYDFGWFIPAFSPERWLGWFGNAGLEFRPGPAAWFIGGSGIGLWLGWAWWAGRRAPERLVMAIACLAPALAGYAVLEIQGYARGTNATYNAYKLFAVYHPLLLAGLCAWLAWIRRPPVRRWAAVLGVALVAVHWCGGTAVRAALARPVLTVDSMISDLRRVEAMPDVASVNLVLEPFWARLWANGLMLGKPQFFAAYTYETRRPTALKGEWDLRDRSLTLRAGGGRDFRPLNERFYLVRRASPRFVDAGFAEGWYPPERDRGINWCWSRGSAALRLVNPHPQALKVSLRCQVRSIGSRDLEIRPRDGAPLWSGRIGDALTAVAIDRALLPPGESRWEFRTPQPAVAPPGDSRTLAVAVYDLEFSSGEDPAS